MKDTLINKGVVLGLVSILGLYLLGTCFPERFWGIHFFNFLDLENTLSMLLVALAVALVPASKLQETLKLKLGNDQASIWIGSLLIAAFYALLTYSLPIAFDPYGDAVRFQDHLEKVATVTPEIYDYLFGFSLDAWSGEKTVLALVSVLSFHLEMTHREVFKLMGSFSAFIFCLVLARLLVEHVKEGSVLVMFLAICLTGPFTLIFHGHAEIYAPAVAMMMVWVFLLSRYIRVGKPLVLVMLIVANVLVIKLHPIGIMLLPATLLAMTQKVFGDKYPLLRQARIIPLIVAPLVLIGLAVYFFVLNDHVDDRSLQVTALQYDHLFLPLFSPEPPLHKYNLFSLNHISDFLNMALMWSPTLLLMLVLVIVYRKDGVSESSIGFIYITLAFILVALLLFAINPLLSMPMDWDLFMLIVPLAIGVAILGMTKHVEQALSSAVPLIIGVSMLSLSFIVSHQNIQNISDRLLTISVHVHNSYYEWTMNIIDRAFSISSDPIDVQLAKRDNLRNRLSQNAQKVDREFAEFLRQDAKHAYKTNQNYEKAQSYLAEALSYNPEDGNNHLTAVELNFEMRQMEAAYQHGLELIRLSHPNEETALRIAIHCALEAERYTEAQKLCADYLQKFESEFVLLIYTRLVSNDQVEKLKLMFQRQET